MASRKGKLVLLLVLLVVALLAVSPAFARPPFSACNGLKYAVTVHQPTPDGLYDVWVAAGCAA
jgi:hypothetical protein